MVTPSKCVHEEIMYTSKRLSPWVLPQVNPLIFLML